MWKQLLIHQHNHRKWTTPQSPRNAKTYSRVQKRKQRKAKRDAKVEASQKSQRVAREARTAQARLRTPRTRALRIDMCALNITQLRTVTWFKNEINNIINNKQHQYLKKKRLCILSEWFHSRSSSGWMGLCCAECVHPTVSFVVSSAPNDCVVSSSSSGTVCRGAKTFPPTVRSWRGKARKGWRWWWDFVSEKKK